MVLQCIIALFSLLSDGAIAPDYFTPTVISKLDFLAAQAYVSAARPKRSVCPIKAGLSCHPPGASLGERTMAGDRGPKRALRLADFAAADQVSVGP